MTMKHLYLILLACLASILSMTAQKGELVDYVNPLVGTQSKISLSTGNTYPAIAMPWGMNFWMPQTGKMGDGWAYTYDADKIRGFKQTHQPSPWINDYGQFAVLPVAGKRVFDQDGRASWFSHKAEQALPHYYRVYLADHDTTVEVTPTERAALFRVRAARYCAEFTASRAEARARRSSPSRMRSGDSSENENRSSRDPSPLAKKPEPA